MPKLCLFNPIEPTPNPKGSPSQHAKGARYETKQYGAFRRIVIGDWFFLINGALFPTEFWINKLPTVYNKLGSRPQNRICSQIDQPTHITPKSKTQNTPQNPKIPLRRAGVHTTGGLVPPRQRVSRTSSGGGRVDVLLLTAAPGRSTSEVRPSKCFFAKAFQRYDVRHNYATLPSSLSAASLLRCTTTLYSVSHRRPSLYQSGIFAAVGESRFSRSYPERKKDRLSRLDNSEERPTKRDLSAFFFMCTSRQEEIGSSFVMASVALVSSGIHPLSFLSSPDYPRLHPAVSCAFAPLANTCIITRPARLFHLYPFRGSLCTVVTNSQCFWFATGPR